MNKKKFWTSDKLVALTALSISMITLFIFIRQTNIMEKQSHLSVMPYLAIDASNNGLEKKFTLELVNHGVGPAIIQDKKIIYNGKEFEMEFDEFLHNHVEGMDSVNITSNASIHEGLAIPAGESRTIIIIGGGSRSYHDFMKILNTLQPPGFNYTIRYKSIYNDKWEINAFGTEPVSLE